MKNTHSVKNFLVKWCLSLFLIWTITSLPSYSKTSFFPTQNFTVTVIDIKTGEPLIGATVWNATTKIGITTNIEGQAFLENNGHRDIIEISYVGYQTQKIPFFELRENLNGIVKMYEAIVSTLR